MGCALVIIHTLFAVIKACLSAAVAALMAGISLVVTVLVLGGILAFTLAGAFGLGGSRLASRRRARRNEGR